MPSALSSLFSIYLLSPLRGRARERERAGFLAPEKEGEYGAEEVEMGGEDRRERRKEEREKKSPLATEHSVARERKIPSRDGGEKGRTREREREKKKEKEEREKRERIHREMEELKRERAGERRKRGRKKTEGGELLLATEIISVARGMTRARTKEKGREKEEEEEK